MRKHTYLFSTFSILLFVLGCKEKSKSNVNYPVKVIYLLKTSPKSEWSGFITTNRDSVSKLYSVFMKSRKSRVSSKEKLKKMPILHRFFFYGKNDKPLYSFSVLGNNFISYKKGIYVAWDILLTTNILLHRKKFTRLKKEKITTIPELNLKPLN